jgi:hypothetical protein
VRFADSYAERFVDRVQLMNLNQKNLEGRIVNPKRYDEGAIFQIFLMVYPPRTIHCGRPSDLDGSLHLETTNITLIAKFRRRIYARTIGACDKDIWINPSAFWAAGRPGRVLDLGWVVRRD